MPQDVGQPFAVASADDDTLPRWDFSNFYPAIDSPEFETDFAQVIDMIEDFASRYEGKVTQLDGDALAAAIAAYKDIGARFSKLGTYVQLKAEQDNEKYGPAKVGFQSKASPLGSKLAFFTDEIKKCDEADLTAALAGSATLQKWAPFIDNVRRAIPHTPPLDVQRYSGELNASSGWVKLFDDHHVAKRYPFEGKDLTQEEILTIVANHPDAARREAAHQVFQDGIAGDAALFTHIHNEQMRLARVDNRWTKFDKPWDVRHFANNVEPAVVDALEQAVKDSYPRIAHRFYALKAKLMGVPHLKPSDRNVNVFEDKEQRYIPFAEAKQIVLDAYGAFLPQMADEAKAFFDNGWIDAPVDENKQGGAFSHPGAAQLAQPMVMLNYLGTPRDVATLAHELGHGVHQKLAAHKGDAIVETPLTLAETASVFGEMLTFKSLLARAADDEERRVLLFDKVNAMINTVVRQISFYDFEKRINIAYDQKGGPLTPEEMGQEWVGALQDSYGPALPLDDDYGPLFGYIPHLVHVPFYVYAYAFGDAMVNALYGVYEEGSVPDFKEKYIEMLEAGGTLKPEDLEEMFGLDIADPAFWNKGLAVIEEMLDELEELCEPLLQQKTVPVAAPTGAPGPKA